jgi:DTW domain
MAETHIETALAEDERRFIDYLKDVASSSSSSSTSKRAFCCNTSRSLYCPECFKVLIPPEEWPPSIRNFRDLELPFAMDIILGRKERRNSSSGIQMMAICHMMKCSATPRNINATEVDDNYNEPQGARFCEQGGAWWKDGGFYDVNRGESVPSYPTDSKPITFVLFPSKKSVPISSVADKIQRLVIMDVKWTRSGIIDLNPSLSSLTAVHLEYPPKQSQFWRWHNNGEGMLSTMEAIYFAAMEISAARGWPQKKREKIIDIMWLFALQRRAIIHQRLRESEETTEPMPFSVEGKRQQRDFRVRKMEMIFDQTEAKQER